MFSKRKDGRTLKSLDPIVSLTPYLMPMRCDAQVMLDLKTDYEKLARYITEKGAQGHKITFTELVIAAYVRVISQLPEVNRFVVNKRIYARTELTVSFVLLMDTGNSGAIEENTVKCHFNPYDTVFDVSERVKKLINENRKQEANNFTLVLARFLSRPILASPIVSLVRFLDRCGLMPEAIREASPFHTSMFLTNMASIGMPAVKHHIYNFGTTSLFISMGALERTTVPGPDGKPQRKRTMPFGIVADERICAGAVYAKMVALFNELMNNPALLEVPPETVYFEEGLAYDENGLLKNKKKKTAKKENLSA